MSIFSELKGYHFPGIKTCYYTTPEMTPEMSGSLQSWTQPNFQDMTEKAKSLRSLKGKGCTLLTAQGVSMYLAI